MPDEKNKLSYDASQFLESGIEAWQSGPEIPAVWLMLTTAQYGEWYEGMPLTLETYDEKENIIPMPMDEITNTICYRCLKSIYIPKMLPNYDEHFCELCWYKMSANTTLYGMRKMLISMGCDQDELDKMWKLNGR